MKSSDRRATAELLIAIIEAAVERGCRHYSESGELLATTLAVLVECLQRVGFVTVEEPGRAGAAAFRYPPIPSPAPRRHRGATQSRRPCDFRRPPISGPSPPAPAHARARASRRFASAGLPESVHAMALHGSAWRRCG